jgi:glyoxylase-like metal-dependent hydrolase (beta-lactamase superfamily II)
MLGAALALAGGCGLSKVEVAEGVLVIAGKPPAPNSGIVASKFGPVVIDGQPGGRAGGTLNAAAKDFAGDEATYLVCTSHHADHTLGNEAFARAEIISTEASRQAFLARADRERKLLADRLGLPGLRASELMPATLTFERSMRLYLGWPAEEIRELLLLELPAGAAPGNLVALLPKEKVLFAGDLVTNKVFPYMGDADLAGWLKALGELDKLDFKTLVPGHGPVGGRELVGATRKFLTELSAAVGAAKASGKTLEQARKELTSLPGCEDWSLVEELVPFAVERLWDQKLPAGAALPAGPLSAPAPLPTP